MAYEKGSGKEIVTSKTMKIPFAFIVCICFHAVTDFNDTVIEAEILGGQTQVLQDIQIFDDNINEAPEVFYVVLDVLSEQRSNVMFGIQRTICRIHQSDRKLSCKYFMHLM